MIINHISYHVICFLPFSFITSTIPICHRTTIILSPQLILSLISFYHIYLYLYYYYHHPYPYYPSSHYYYSIHRSITSATIIITHSSFITSTTIIITHSSLSLPSLHYYHTKSSYRAIGALFVEDKIVLR